MSAERPVVVVGASGFIGSRVEQALATMGVTVRGATAHAVRVDHETVDITADTDRIVEVVRGAAAVVHAASYTGANPRLSRAVNVHGTEQLAAACTAAGVDRLIYVSTAAVYGRGPHRGTTTADAAFAPTSVVSTDRMHAEQIVLSQGGIIIRPNLLVGAGDKWVLGPLARLLQRVDALPVDAHHRRLSVLHVEAAGRLIAAAASDAALPPGTQLFAVQPDPITVADLCDIALSALGIRRPTGRLSPMEMREKTSALGLTEHQFNLAFGDYWFNPETAWSTTAVTPPHTLRLTTPDVAWYRREKNSTVAASGVL